MTDSLTDLAAMLLLFVPLACFVAGTLLHRVMPPLPRREWTAEDEMDYRENQPKGKP